MSDRENKLRALLERVQNHRPEERKTIAAELVERFRTAETGAVAAVAPMATQAVEPRPMPAPVGPPIPVPQTARAAVERAPVPPPARPAVLTPSAPPAAALQSPTRYSSQPPAPEKPLSSLPAAARQSEPPRQAAGPVPVRPQSVAPASEPVVQAIEPSEAPRAKTFGELLELTLSLRPQ